MKQFDPYEFLNDNLEPRPFDKYKNRDGNVHYIHQCDVWTLIEKIQSENNKKIQTATTCACEQPDIETSSDGNTYCWNCTKPIKQGE